MTRTLLLSLIATSFFCAAPGWPGAAQSSSEQLSLADALAGAQKYGAQIQAADIAARLAKEDKKQAVAASLPSLNALNQFIYTEGNGTPSGVFVANDGVHIYNEQAVVHEEVFSFVRRGEIRLAAAAEAVARARVDVAARGLRNTVVANYYAIASAERKLKNAERSLAETQQFFDITRKQEAGGEAAHADTIKAQIQVQQRLRDVSDAQLAVQKAKIALGVLIYPTLELNFDIIDDLAQLAALPARPETVAQASASNPDLHATEGALKEAKLGVTVAKYAYLPSFGLDFYYGIDANQFAARTDYPTPESGRSTLPNYLVTGRQNLGYSAAATLTIPVWNWGSIRSKVRQASLRERQAELDLSLTRRQVQADIASAYNEAQTALGQIDSLRTSADLSNESLRLTVLRYQAGEATTLEVVDAQNTALLARGAYDDGLVRYRVAFETLRTLTGNHQP